MLYFDTKFFVSGLAIFVPSFVIVVLLVRKLQTGGKGVAESAHPHSVT